MRILPYYLFHTIVNAIKKLFRNKVIAIIIALIMGMAVIGAVIGITVGVVLDSVDESSTYEEVDEEYEEPEEPETDEMTEEDRATLMLFVEAGVSVAVLLIVLLNIYFGDKSGVKIFTMSDVNFLFASPLKPQSVLMFKTVLQMGVAVLSSIYLLFQFPNLMKLGIGLRQCFSLFAAWVVLLFIAKLAAVLTYTLAATHAKLRQFIHPFVYTVTGGLILAFAGLMRLGGKTLTQTVEILFVGKHHRMIPLFGWMQGYFMSVIDGKWLSALLYFVLLLLFSVVITFLIWRIKADFYEDALQNAAELQEKTENAAKGVVKRKKERSEKVKRNRDLTGVGAEVFFGKTVYNHRRFAKFGWITPTALTYGFVALLCGLFLNSVVQSHILAPVGFLLAAILFFRNLGNPIAHETSHDFLFLVPEKASSKLLYTLAGGLYESAMDLFPAAVLSVFFCGGNFVELIGWVLVWLSLDLFCSSVGTFIELSLPSYFVPAIRSLLAMNIRMAAILPGLIILIIGVTTTVLPALFGTVLLNIGVSAVLFLVTPYFLHAGKN